MSHARLQTVIEAAWDQRDTISPATRGEVREAVATALDLLDSGKARVAEKTGRRLGRAPMAQEGRLLSFRLNDMELIAGRRAGPAGGTRCPPSSRA